MNNFNLIIYKPKEFSKLLNVTVQTLQNWDNTGVLKARRTPTNRRYYTKQDLNKFLSKKNNNREVG